MEATVKSSPTLAAIDLGSNSFRLLIGFWQDGRFQVQAKRLDTVRLGRGHGSGGRLAAAAIALGLKVLSEYHRIIMASQAVKVRICGTQALRTAVNHGAFMGPAQEIIGWPIEIISGEEEAALTLAGAVGGQLPEDTPVLLADVGGASTEIIFTRHQAAPLVVSLPVGALALTEAVGEGIGRRLIAGNMARLDGFTPPADTMLIGTGGTVTTLAMLDLGLTSYDAGRVDGHILRSVNMDKIYASMMALSPGQRRSLPGLQAGRADIIVAGTMIWQAIMAKLQIERLRVSDAGILEGIILSLTAGNAMYQRYDGLFASPSIVSAP